MKKLFFMLIISLIIVIPVYSQSEELYTMDDGFVVLGGGRLEGEPPFVVVDVASNVVFNVSDVALSPETLSLKLRIADADGAQKSCIVNADEGKISNPELLLEEHCNEALYQLNFSAGGIPADAKIINTAVALQSVVFAIDYEKNEFVNGAFVPIRKVWGSDDNSLLVLTFYGADGEQNTDMFAEYNEAWYPVLRTRNSVKLGIEKFETDYGSLRFDVLTETDFISKDAVFPMDSVTKLIYNNKIVQLSFKQIEAGFPLRSRVSYVNVYLDEPMSDHPVKFKAFSMDCGLPVIRLTYVTSEGMKGIFEKPVYQFLRIHFTDVIPME